MEKIFSYGTLQKDSVQVATFGRELIGTKDKLVGYLLTNSTEARLQQASLTYTGDETDVVEGMLFEVSSSELCKADDYSVVDDCIRVREDVISGQRAWVYVWADADVFLV
ncbi:gamma-glutamylcyclotransferase family protein [Marinomonas sp. PE14-40]|uniref:gamma-glutamylcyclotransferase family protein n=1 Tax=Marinomonas sp. PE14-40 TaxID=3060621 RepID=UPI003F66B773